VCSCVVVLALGNEVLDAEAGLLLGELVAEAVLLDAADLDLLGDACGVAGDAADVDAEVDDERSGVLLGHGISL